MNQNSNQHTACKKVEILREYLENQAPISEIARRYGINPNLIHKWKKQLFEGAVDTFSRKHEKLNHEQNSRIGHLGKKIKDKDSFIVEVLSNSN